jgi:hypothetical protein
MVPWREEVSGGWRKLRKKELHQVCTLRHIGVLLDNQIKEDDMNGMCIRYGRHDKSVQVTVRKPEGRFAGKTPLHRWDCIVS